MELHFGGHLCYGPPIENGFYYDMYSPERSVTPKDYKALETLMRDIVKAKQPFERLVMRKSDLLQMFQVNLGSLVLNSRHSSKKKRFGRVQVKLFI